MARGARAGLFLERLQQQVHSHQQLQAQSGSSPAVAEPTHPARPQHAQHAEQPARDSQAHQRLSSDERDEWSDDDQEQGIDMQTVVAPVFGDS